MTKKITTDKRTYKLLPLQHCFITYADMSAIETDKDVL